MVILTTAFDDCRGFPPSVAMTTISKLLNTSWSNSTRLKISPEVVLIEKVLATVRLANENAISAFVVES